MRGKYSNDVKKMSFLHFFEVMYILILYNIMSEKEVHYSQH